ncbi:MAG: VTT domain-containing protein [Gemmatimonadales bacterium]
MSTSPDASRSVGRWLRRQVAPREWNSLLWGCATVALAGIALSAFVPSASELAVLFSTTLLANGPYGAFIPAAQEAIVMVFSRLYHPAIVALVATVSATFAEYLNYKLFAAAVHSDYLSGVRHSRAVQRVVAWFDIQPFVTVFVTALAPIPFVLTRLVATTARYPTGRFLTANALARFPRFWLYGSLGVLIPLSTGGLVVAGVAVSIVLGMLIWWYRRSRHEGVLDAVLRTVD